MQSAGFVVSSSVNRAPISKHHGFEGECWAHESFASLKHDDDFGDWGVSGIQAEDTKLSSEKQKESRSHNCLDSIDYNIKINPPAPPLYNNGTKSHHRNSDKTGSNDRKKKNVPKLAVSPKEIRKGGLYDHQPKISIEIGDPDDEDGNDDVLLPIEYSIPLGMPTHTRSKDCPVSKRRLLISNNARDNSETKETTQTKESDALPSSRRERWQQIDSSRSFLISNSMNSKNSARRQLSSRRLVQDKDERNDDPKKDLKIIARTESMGNWFREGQTQNGPISQRDSDNGNATNNEDAGIANSAIFECADTTFWVRSNGRRAKREPSRAKSMPLDNEPSDLKTPPSRAKSENVSDFATKYRGDEHGHRRPSRRSSMTGGSRVKSEQKQESNERGHRRPKSRRSSMSGSNGKSGQSKDILYPSRSSAMEELAELVKYTAPRSVEEIRRERRASMNGGTNHKKSERPSRRSSMNVSRSNIKSDRPSRRSSMNVASSMQSNRQSRRASMSGGTSTGGDDGGGGGTRPKSSNSGRSSDRVRTRPQSFHSKPERTLSPLDLVIIVSPESSTSSVGLKYAKNDRTPIASSVTSPKASSRRSQFTSDRRPSKRLLERSRSKRREPRVSSSIRKKREDRSEETTSDISKKDRKETKKKDADPRRRSSMR